jgi:hypothetical protein
MIVKINYKKLHSHDDYERQAYADSLRDRTRYLRKQVLKQQFSYFDPVQDPDVLKALLHLASDKCVEVRIKATYALGDHSDASSRNMLLKLLADSDPDVRKAAKHAWDRIGENEKKVKALNEAIRERDRRKEDGSLQKRYKEIRAEEKRRADEENKLVASYEGKFIRFIIQGSRRYEIKACLYQGRFAIECDCPAGKEHMYCKHIDCLLDGDTEYLVSPNAEEMTILPLLIKRSLAYPEYKNLGLPGAAKNFKIATLFSHIDVK